MCTFENGFTLCTCAEKSQGYDWVLFRYLGEEETTEIGRYLMPDEDLGHGLTAEFVKTELNRPRATVFDFEYSPAEGDNLYIRRHTDSSYMSFIHRDGVWTKDHYYVFTARLEEMFSGSVAPS